MNILTVLNRDGGTLRTTDIEELSTHIREAFGDAGHSVDIEVVAGKDIIETLEAAANADADVVMVGGGDGTISAAASLLHGTDKALAVLPAGTMNLFARSLGIPLNLEEAIEAFASGRIETVDVASANGKIFVHQFSIGMHPRLIQLRDRMKFGSRLGKIRASMQAAFITLRNPPRIHADLKMSHTSVSVVASSIGVSNNLFGEGHLPYADMPDQGHLGVYIARAPKMRNIILFALHMMVGRWRDNPEVEVHKSDVVEISIRPGPHRLRCSMDGELCELEARTELQILPGALKVLLPPQTENPPQRAGFENDLAG